MYKKRAYRGWVKAEGLITFEGVERETDLLISCDKDLSRQARAFVLNYRKEIEDYIRAHPAFHSSLKPVEVERDAPQIVRVMAEASEKASVGPMAAIAGAIAEFVGRDLLELSQNAIVENGGDIFIKSSRKAAVGIFAGESPLSGRLAIEVDSGEKGIGVCTSSGTVSHSLSFGKADAATIISDSTALADAVATAAGNVVKTADDIEKGINFARSIEGVKGVLIIVKDKMGSWGEIKLV